MLFPRAQACLVPRSHLALGLRVQKKTECASGFLAYVTDESWTFTHFAASLVEHLSKFPHALAEVQGYPTIKLLSCLCLVCT